MFSKKLFLIFALVALLSGGFYYFFTKRKENFSRTYAEILRTQDLTPFFDDQAKVNKDRLKEKRVAENFKSAIKSAEIYSKNSEQVIMYWKDASGFSSPIIWQKIKGEWKIISL